MNMKPQKTAASSIFLDLPSKEIVLSFPLLDAQGSELLARADLLASYIKRHMDAARAVDNMEQMVVIYLEDEQEEFHIQRTGTGLLITDHFTSYSRPVGDGLIVYLSANRCVVSNRLHDEKVALERLLGVHIDLNAIHEMAYGNQPRIDADTDCGCFFCNRRFRGKDIQEYTSEVLGSKTAICPCCGMDTVLAESVLPSGVPCSDALIALINRAFFGGDSLKD